MLIVFGGLPGAGKTTLARGIAGHIGAAYLRIDTIEQALRDCGELPGEMGPAGYLVAYAVALSNLRLGVAVVADSRNPLEITRAAWRQVAQDAGVQVLEIEVVCSDAAEHRRRLATRVADIPGLPLVAWAQVSRDYQPWTSRHLMVDTAGRTEADCLAQIHAALAAV